MNTKILKKFIAILLVCIMVLNTTSTFAAFSLFNRNSSKTSSIVSFFSNLFNKKSTTTEEKKVEETKVSSILPSETTEGKETLSKISNIVQSVIQRYQKTTGFTSFLKKIFGKSSSNTVTNPEEALKESIVLTAKSVPSIGNTLEVADLDPDKLVTIFTNLSTLDLTNPETISTLIKQLAKAIINTTDLTDGMISKNDLTAMIADMTSGQYYYPDGEVVETYHTIKDTARLTNYAMISPKDSKGKPIGIGKVTLYGGEYGKEGKEVYMVSLNGTGFTEGQQYGVIADLLSGMETDSQYLRSAVQAVLDTVPKGSSLYIAGMSLGGMIAQQLMVQDAILEKFKIEHVTIIGSPALCVKERKEQFAKYPKNAPSADNIVRLIDDQDLIPYACIDYLGKFGDYFIDGTSYNLEKNAVTETLLTDNAQKHYKTGIGHHFVGYLADETWNNYDPLGYKITDKNTAHTIKIDHDNFKYFDSPSFSNGKLSMFE